MVHVGSVVDYGVEGSFDAGDASREVARRELHHGPEAGEAAADGRRSWHRSSALRGRVGPQRNDEPEDDVADGGDE